MRHQAERDPAANHIGPDLEDLALPVQKHDVDGELHGERVDAFAWDDPQALAWSESLMLQQACAPLGAGIGDIGPIGQDPPTCLIGYTKFGQTSG